MPADIPPRPIDEGMAALLELREVTKTFTGVQALKSVSLELHPGELHGLVGHNGAGKSTLIKIISGALRPDSGAILVDGRLYPALDPRLADHLGIAAVYQEQQLVPHLSAAANIWLAHEPCRLGFLPDFHDMEERTRALSARYGLDVPPRESVARLSIAKRQEVAILKAMVRNAKILLLDEPTAALTGMQIDALFALLDAVRAMGVGAFYISHRLEEVLRVCQRVSVLREGALVASAPSAQLSSAALVELMLGEATGGGEQPTAPPAGPSAQRDVVMTLRGVLLLGGQQRIDIDLRRGEILGLAGTPDSGARELGRAMAGILRPASGEIRLRGRIFDPGTPDQAIHNGAYLVPEDVRQEGLVPVLSVGRNITLSATGRLGRGPLASESAERTVATGMVRTLDIATPSIDQQVRRLSGGNQRKVLFAKALAVRPELLVLEEPAEGLDVRTRREIHRILRDLAADGKAIVLVSSDLDELLEVTDRILALRDRAIVREFDSPQTTSAEILSVVLSAPAAR